MVPVVPILAGYAGRVDLLKVPGFHPERRSLIRGPAVPFDKGFTNLRMIFFASERRTSGPATGNPISWREVRRFAPRP
jgi:hypothetical protein